MTWLMGILRVGPEEQLLIWKLMNQFKKWFRILSLFIDIYRKYVLVILLKDKKVLEFFSLFKSGRKTNKIWMDKAQKIWCSPKSDRWFFFLTLSVRGPFHKKDFKWKIIGGTGLISEKMEVLYAEHNERVEAATDGYSVTGDSLQYTYSVPVTKNYQSIQSRCLVHEFSSTYIF